MLGSENIKVKFNYFLFVSWLWCVEMESIDMPRKWKVSVLCFLKIVLVVPHLLLLIPHFDEGLAIRHIDQVFSFSQCAAALSYCIGAILGPTSRNSFITQSVVTIKVSFHYVYWLQNGFLRFTLLLPSTQRYSVIWRLSRERPAASLKAHVARFRSVIIRIFHSSLPCWLLCTTTLALMANLPPFLSIFLFFLFA